MSCLNPIDLFCSVTGLCKASEEQQVEKKEPPKDESPAYAGRVRIFEGLTREGLKRILEGHPIIEQDQKRLEAIFESDPNGRSDQIDPGLETLSLAEEFQFLNREVWKGNRPFFFRNRTRDLNVYREQNNIDVWKAKPDVIRDELGIRIVNHPLAIFTHQLGVMDLDSFRGLVAFDQLAETVFAELPELKHNRNLQLLYPGSGDHVAPLMTALRLIDQDRIDRATYTFTEIDETVYPVLCRFFSQMVQNGLLDSFSAAAPKVFGPDGSEGKEMGMELVYQRKPIRLVFALNRSGADYYRDEYLQNADIVVIHDPGNNSLKLSYDLLGQMLFKKSRSEPAFRAKPQIVILEGEKSPKYFFVSMERTVTFPTRVKPIVLPGPYGHCDGIKGLGEVTDCEFQSAIVLRLDDPALMEEADKASSPATLTDRFYSEVPTGIGIASPPDFDE